MAVPPETSSYKKVVTEFIDILDAGELHRLEEVLSPDIITEWPQSGERVRGIDNLRAVLQNYPGGPPGFKTEPVQVLEDQPHYVMTPTFNLVRVESTGGHQVAIVKSRYPDGSLWWIIGISTVQDDKIVRQIQYFAPAYPAPEWRAQWVEPLK
jgi:hypothetical protein